MLLTEQNDHFYREDFNNLLYQEGRHLLTPDPKYTVHQSLHTW